MTEKEMLDKLIDLGFSAINIAEALHITNFNLEEATELLYLYTTSDRMSIIYELLKLKKRIEKLEKDK